MKTEILYGIHAVKEALAAGRRELLELFVAPDHLAAGRLQGLVTTAKARGVAIRTMAPAQLAALAGSGARPEVALRASTYPFIGLERVLAALQGPESGPVLVLDRIMDPHNLGAILRSALCAGVSAVLIPKDHAAPPTPLVSKISAGALEHVPLAQVTNVVRSLEMLKSYGRWVAGLDRGAALTIFKADLTMPLALVVGGEGRGLRTLVRKTCDLMVSIPQSGAIDSLNASAAAAVALYEIRRQCGIDLRSSAAGATDGR